MIDAVLPLPVSLKWVAYACRMAGAAKPRWSRERSTWTTTTRDETLRITSPAPHVVRIDSDSDTAHRLVTAFYTGMRAHARLAAA
ncbi:MAG: hypothetical protein KIT84_29225 [Labilithrix sp.]|nr:hypothetical protein [Labilithrix sp.]MCW5815144.1 hypothetical protein [Labilithrix sp.]